MDWRASKEDIMIQEQTDKEMIEWAGVTYEGDEIPIQLQRLIWVARNQGKRIAWRDMFQISSQQLHSYSADLPDVSSLESAKG